MSLGDSFVTLAELKAKAVEDILRFVFWTIVFTSPLWIAGGCGYLTYVGLKALGCP